MSRWLKPCAALAASATIASTAASLALAGGSNTSIDVGKTPLGRILVDSKGITLYDFPPDKGTTSVCYGACAALWPPLIAKGKLVAGPGVRASLLGTTKRKDGKLEVTYNGHDRPGPQPVRRSVVGALCRRQGDPPWLAQQTQPP
jgi:predicted lipoprotein with Yx(FWY)xxD motif